MSDGWQPIETAPKNERMLLFFDKIYKVPFIGWYNHPSKEFEIVDFFKDKKEQYAAPTHWHALPENPTRKI